MLTDFKVVGIGIKVAENGPVVSVLLSSVNLLICWALAMRATGHV